MSHVLQVGLGGLGGLGNLNQAGLGSLKVPPPPLAPEAAAAIAAAAQSAPSTPVDPLRSSGPLNELQPSSRLYVVVHKGVTEELLTSLFCILPGMELCDLKRDHHTGLSRVDFLLPIHQQRGYKGENQHTCKQDLRQVCHGDIVCPPFGRSLAISRAIVILLFLFLLSAEDRLLK